MIRTIQDFQNLWQYEVEMTLKLFDCLTDEKLFIRVTPEGRELRQVAFHLTQTIGEMLARCGLTIDAPLHTEAPPKAVSDLKASFSRAATSALQEVKAHWNDASLLEVNDMYGEQWAKGFTLICMILHHAHHRGQMTVLMRQAGLKVVGVYGPAKEEWLAMGLPAMA